MCLDAARTAAAAVVFAPFESSITDTVRPYCGIRCCEPRPAPPRPAATSLPPMKIGGALQVLRPAGEDRPVDQALHLVRLDAAIAEQVSTPGVDGDDAVEHARLRVGVELDQDLALVGHESGRSQESVSRDADRPLSS